MHGGITLQFLEVVHYEAHVPFSQAIGGEQDERQQGTAALATSNVPVRR